MGTWLGGYHILTNIFLFRFATTLFSHEKFNQRMIMKQLIFFFCSWFRVSKYKEMWFPGNIFSYHKKLIFKLCSFENLKETILEIRRSSFSIDSLLNYLYFVISIQKKLWQSLVTLKSKHENNNRGNIDELNAHGSFYNCDVVH